MAQLRTGHSPLLADYLHRIRRRDSATCPYCNGADETAEHLVLHCSAHEQARRDIWPGGQFNTDPRRLWDFLERIGAVTRPRDKEWERERSRGFFCAFLCAWYCLNQLAWIHEMFHRQGLWAVLSLEQGLTFSFIYVFVFYLLYGLCTRWVVHCNSEESQVWESLVSLQEGTTVQSRCWPVFKSEMTVWGRLFHLLLTENTSWAY